MLLIEDCDNYGIFSEEQRQEFLFQLFKGFSLGGEICQFEYDIDPYLNITKAFYKDLVCVQKNPEGKVSVLSQIYKFRCKVSLISHSLLYYFNIQNKNGQIVFPDPSNHENSFAFIIIDPTKKHLHCLWHSFGCGSF